MGRVLWDFGSAVAVFSVASVYCIAVRVACHVGPDGVEWLAAKDPLSSVDWSCGCPSSLTLRWC